jgi:hypothetical protein
MGETFDVYKDRTEYTPGVVPQTVSLTRSGEVMSGGQVVARMSSTATQTSSVVHSPLELRAAVDGAFTTHLEKLVNYPGDARVEGGGVSDFDQYVDVTDGPAVYSFSGRLFDLSQVRLVKVTAAGDQELHVDWGRFNEPEGHAFNFTGTFDPGRYFFKVNASGGTALPFPDTIDISGSVRDVSIRVSQVPEPGGALAVIAALAGMMTRRRSGR